MTIILLLTVLCNVRPSKNFTMNCKPQTHSFYTNKKECNVASLNVTNSTCIEVVLNEANNASEIKESK